MTAQNPPIAVRKPHVNEVHGVRWEDPWHWLRDPNYPDVQDTYVLGYLKAETAFFAAAMKPHEGLVETLFQEMKGRIKEDDSSVPIKDGDWLYRSAFKEGTQYRDWYRQPASGGDEGLIYSENAEAEGKEYYRLGAFAVSPDGNLLATMVDDDGSERFKLKVRDLSTGLDIETVTRVGIGQPVWTNDSQGLAFTEVNDQWRSYRAQYHRVGDDPAKAATIYEEKADIAFSVGVARSTDDSLIFISTGNNSSNEIHFFPAGQPDAALTLIRARQAAVQYEVDAAHGKLWILTNDIHVNFRIATADPASPGEWQELVAGSDRTYLRGFTSHRDHLLIQARVDGLDQLLLRDYASGEQGRVPFAEASYSASFTGNPEFAPDRYRLAYSSMVTPATVYDFPPAETRLETRKVQEIPSGYDASLYVTERVTVTARDGARVPVSVLRRKDFARD
jgi:oligopeptidase B